MVSSVEYRFGKVERLPHRIQWLCDNAPGYTSRETILFARMIGLEVCTTPYYSPESNGMAESFIKTFKRDYVYMRDLPDAKTVMELLPLWCEDYNPHKGLHMRSPKEYRVMQITCEGCPVRWGQLHFPHLKNTFDYEFSGAACFSPAQIFNVANLTYQGNSCKHCLLHPLSFSGTGQEKFHPAEHF